MNIEHQLEEKQMEQIEMKDEIEILKEELKKIKQELD